MEQVVWISTPWIGDGMLWPGFPKTAQYLWFDFPKAIYVDDQLVFLSHINPSIPSKYNYPEVCSKEWYATEKGLRYTQVLPNGLRFTGEVTTFDSLTVVLNFMIKNISRDTLKNIRLATCLYLAHVEGFDELTNLNKLVYSSHLGWTSVDDKQLPFSGAGYNVGNDPRSTRKSELPIIIAQHAEDRFSIGISWETSTQFLWANKYLPSINADPFVGTLLPSEERTINGWLYFHRGSIGSFLSNKSKIKVVGQ